ncbi:YicC/YloC family endoribonuclease [Aminomonas paucivorans]|uniref:YicC domain protein n=1 Tax=Aminomonas paucivorans DSM 12260 TaxID=584708 RepID=E3CYA6_9BACT|nr:YicC/YloC family endoribonuclease [Aminomonas paucivorans]EFQ23639.1 domain of unknown function DUF1732 [Aminomonas paucivorans DSM 12260]
MFTSMTGYGRAQVERDWGSLSLELWSVNHRYQEVTVRLPRELASWEPWFHQRLRKGFRRGKVQGKLEILWAASRKAGRVNREAFLHFFRELDALRRETGEGGDIALDRLLGMPGVLEVPLLEGQTSQEDLETLLEGLLQEALGAWNAMRRTEGAALWGEVLGHLESYEGWIRRIDETWASSRDQAYEATKGRIRELLDAAGVAPDEHRWMQELAYLADRWDVSEELARIRSHLSQFRKLGQEAEGSGRKLDFLVQELNRETNTLDSKVADAAIRALAVEAKAALERVREQIQNLE